MKYARLINDIVQEVFTPPTGVDVSECFHPDLCAQFVPAPDNVEVGFLRRTDGSFEAPPKPLAVTVLGDDQ